MNKIQKVIAILQHGFKFGLSTMSECGAYKRHVYWGTTLGDGKATLNE